MTALNPPRWMSHVGLCVSDLDQAVDWYTQVMGCTVIIGPMEMVADGTYNGRICTDIFGADFRHARMIHLATGNGVGLELFQFIDPPPPPHPTNGPYPNSGISHICVVDPDIDGLARTIVAHGGSQRSLVWSMFEGAPFKLVYCEDPFGNAIEIYSHSYAEMLGQQAVAR